MDVDTNNTLIEDEINILQWPDYLVISAIMSVPVIIGFYYRFSGDRQRSLAEYFNADNSLGLIGFLILPIAMMVTYISGYNILQISGESYIRGLLIVLMYTTDVYIMPIIVFCYLPVFFDLKVVSIYEYLEKRFGLHTRLLVSIACFADMMLLTSMTLNASSTALEAITGMSSIVNILVLTIIGTFYSTLGGIKAILITDLFHGLLIIVTLSTIIGIAAQNIDGGIGGIWSIAQEGQRINFSEFSFDPTVQYTYLSLLIGGGLICLTHIAVNQVQVQRLMAIKSKEVAINVLFLCGPFITLIGFLACFAGLSIYAIYKDCDPVASGKILTYDKILPYFTKEKLSPGMVGLIVSGVFGVSLSAISAMTNSLAAVALEDYVRPLYRKLGKDFYERKAVFTAKLLTVLNGVICMFLALDAQAMGKIIYIVFSLHKAVSGPVLGIFTLGMISESANEVGITIGVNTAIIVCLWITFGQPKPPVPMFPVSIESCANSTALNLTEQMDFNSTIQPDQSSYFYLYRISYLWYNPIGLIITLIVGYVASIIVRHIQKGNNIEHDPRLFMPCVASRIKRRRQDAEKTTISQIFVLESMR